LSTEYNNPANVCAIVARFLVPAILIVYHLVHTVVVAELYDTLVNTVNLRGYFSAPVVAIVVGVMHFSLRVHAL
jgi:hypothetical protein